MKMIEYQLIRSSRRTIAIQISPDGTVTVRAPQHCSKAVIENFILEKQDWIRRKQQELKRRRQEREERREKQVPWTETDYQKARELARTVFAQKTALYASLMGVSYGRISIRDQKTRWGSCSSKGNLNFNWRLILAPEEVLDYVVVHELAHRKEMNHSPGFWAIVEEVLPDYRRRRLWLKQQGDRLMELCNGGNFGGKEANNI